MKVIKHLFSNYILSIILLTTLPFIANAQNFWEFPTQKSGNAITDTSCPFYNFGDPEVNVEFQLALGGEGDNWAADIDYTPDSNYVMLYANNGANFSEFSKTGELLWSRKLLASGDTVFSTSQFVQLDGNYYLAGCWGEYHTRSFGVMKIDLLGNIKWFKKIFQELVSTKKSNPNENPLIRIATVENNNFLLSIEANENMYLAKFDSSMNQLWFLSDIKLNSTDLGWPLKMFLTDDYYTILSNFKYWKIDKLGNIITSDSLHGRYHNNAILQNNKFYVCGIEYPNQWVRKYSMDMELEKEYSIGYDEFYKNISFAADIKVLTDGSVLVFYDFEYLGTLEGDMHTNLNILHLDKNLNCLSTINLFAPGSQHANELLIDRDQDYILYGSGYHEYSGRDMLIFAKLSGWPLPVNERKTMLKLTILPNPVQDVLQVSFDTEKTGTLCLFNVDGKLIHTKNIYHEKDTILQMSTYTNGIYLIRFTDELNNQYFSKTVKN
jgi:hypothetical protein